MVESAQEQDSSARAAAGTAMLLLQAAASLAEIGPFARRERETPQAAARLYHAAAMRARRGVARGG